MQKLLKISYYLLLVLFCYSCKDVIKNEDVAGAVKANTINDDSLSGHSLSDYFYNFDEQIDAQYLYYSVPYYDGMIHNTMRSPEDIDFDRDTLNFKTFPDYLLDVVQNDQSLDKSLYYLNESDASANNWCDTLLLSYKGSCPGSVDFNGDGSKASTGSYSGLKVSRDTTFIVSWDDVDSLEWLPEKKRYDVVLKATNYDTAKVAYSDLSTPDLYDSLIYIGIIDTNRVTVDNLLYIDRSEWNRYDTTYKQKEYSIILEHTFNYQQIKISKDSLMFRVNSDCNQNGVVDEAEKFWDWGADWCPDSLETGEGSCNASKIGVPCNCLGNWLVEDVDTINSNWQMAIDSGYHLDSLWMYGENWRNLDPNGDRWRDCGCDGLCYSDEGWSGSDPGESEGNKIVDCDEEFEFSGSYEYDIPSESGEYFEDIGNGVVDEAEYCSLIEGVQCVGQFADRNCNGKWDGVETEATKNSGNGQRDSAEKWRDDNGDGIVQANEIYYVSDKMETYLINYPEIGDPAPLGGIDPDDTIRLKYFDGSNYFYITYDSLIDVQDVEKKYSASYRPVDSIRTIYTNKVVESKLDGQSSDYFITKTSWYEPVADDFGQRDYGYDYHIFNKDYSSGRVIKLVHNEYFKHYGYSIEEDLKSFDESFYIDPAIDQEVYIYAPNGNIRDGEYYHKEDTLYTDVGNYHLSDEFIVQKDDSVSIGIRRNLYDKDLYPGQIRCLADPDLTVSKVSDCPIDSVITDAYKIIRTKTFTMIGNGVEFGFRNTFWLGRDAVKNKPMGIIKDRIEYRWSEAPWEVYGSGWKEFSRLELRSLRSPSTSLPRLFTAPQVVSIDYIGNSPEFNFDPFRLSSSYGIHRVRKYYGE